MHYLRPEAADQTDKAESGGPYPGRSERVDGYARWKKICRDSSLRDQAQVELIFFAGKALRKEGKHLLGSPAAKMRDEQEDSRAINHQVFHRKLREFSTEGEN